MAIWIALGVTIAAYLVTVAMNWGYNKKQFESIVEKQEDSVERYDAYHKIHFQHAENDEKHFKDFELHWTSRERDSLSKTLDLMQKDIAELLRRTPK